MKTYTREFKQQAVELAESLDNAASAAEQLGIPSATLYKWISLSKKSLSLESKGNQVASKSSTENEEVVRLRRENAELKKVNHILKSAAAFFSQDHLK